MTGHVDLAGEYKAIASGLVLHHVIDESLGASLVQMAGYRNRLTHLYHEVSNEELHAILETDLGDIRDFIAQIKDFLVRAGDPCVKD